MGLAYLIGLKAEMYAMIPPAAAARMLQATRRFADVSLAPSVQ